MTVISRSIGCSGALRPAAELQPGCSSLIFIQPVPRPPGGQHAHAQIDSRSIDSWQSGLISDWRLLPPTTYEYSRALMNAKMNSDSHLSLSRTAYRQPARCRRQTATMSVLADETDVNFTRRTYDQEFACCLAGKRLLHVHHCSRLVIIIALHH